MNRGLVAKPRVINNLHALKRLSKIDFRHFLAGRSRTWRKSFQTEMDTNVEKQPRLTKYENRPADRRIGRSQGSSCRRSCQFL
jgi:hypothetical protein